MTISGHRLSEAPARLIRSLLLHLFALGCCALPCGSAAQDSSTLAGVGAILLLDPATQGPQIADVLPDSPAERCHLAPGLVITKIDALPTAGKTLAECVELIRGKSGTFVWLSTTDPNTGESKNFLLLRERLSLHP